MDMGTWDQSGGRGIIGCWGKQCFGYNSLCMGVSFNLVSLDLNT